MTTTMTRPDAMWGFEEGDEIAPELTALQLLGVGTRYEAYFAFDERLHHASVIKVLRPDLLGDDRALQGLRAEADILKELNHPAIARLLRDGTDEERPHIVLEHVEGPRLSTLIRRFGPLEPQQAASLAVEVASALHYLHGLGIVHLDVKPKNLIMGAPPRLIDLSIARPFHEAASLTTPIGDAYMAPEQAVPARGLVGPAADVWGLGATLYEALAGRPAFPRESDDEYASAEEQRFKQLTHRPQPLPRHIPNELGLVTWRALAPDPSDRPTAREVGEAVEPLLQRPRRLILNQLKPR